MTRTESKVNIPSQWQTVGHPGFFSKSRDEMFQKWNDEHGEGNWRIAWQLRNGDVLNYDGIFLRAFVAGYARYFLERPDEAEAITEHAYAYDKTPIDRAAAFDPHALCNQPGLPNQFHHVAINIALEDILGYSFRGSEPIQVRDGKPDMPRDEWPAGWRWGPGHVPAARPELIPDVDIEGWWSEGTIEETYQKAKVLQISR